MPAARKDRRPAGVGGTGAGSAPRGGGRVGAVLAAAVLLLSTAAEGQVPVQVGYAARVRIDISGTERSILRGPLHQPIVGTYRGVRGDTLLLQLVPGSEPLRVPTSSIHAMYLSRGKPSRVESAVRRALLPTLASAAISALVAGLRDDADVSPGEAAWLAARRTAAFSMATGFLFPRERWLRIETGPREGARPARASNSH